MGAWTRGWWGTVLAGALAAAPADGSIRVVTYNIDADTGTSTPQPGLDTVLAAIGSTHLAGNGSPSTRWPCRSCTSRPPPRSPRW